MPVDEQHLLPELRNEHREPGRHERPPHATLAAADRDHAHGARCTKPRPRDQSGPTRPTAPVRPQPARSHSPRAPTAPGYKGRRWWCSWRARPEVADGAVLLYGDEATEDVSRQMRRQMRPQFYAALSAA